MISNSTLYYTFSTNAQVLGALVAILAAFVHFRIIRLETYLIGDGKAILHRWENYWKEYRENWDITPEIEKTLKERLEDAIDRKSINEIEDALKNLKWLEEKTEQKNVRNSLSYLIEKWFLGTKKQIKDLKNLTIFVVVLAIFTISMSIVFLSMVDKLATCEFSSLISLVINLFFTIITLFLSGCIIYEGLNEDAIHEVDIDNPIDFSEHMKRKQQF